MSVVASTHSVRTARPAKHDIGCGRIAAPIPSRLQGRRLCYCRPLGRRGFDTVRCRTRAVSDTVSPWQISCHWRMQAEPNWLRRKSVVGAQRSQRWQVPSSAMTFAPHCGCDSIEDRIRASFYGISDGIEQVYAVFSTKRALILQCSPPTAINCWA